MFKAQVCSERNALSFTHSVTELQIIITPTEDCLLHQNHIKICKGEENYYRDQNLLQPLRINAVKYDLKCAAYYNILHSEIVFNLAVGICLYSATGCKR